MPSILDRHLMRFQADPSNRRAFDALEEAQFVAGDWQGLLDLYQHRLRAPDLQADPSARAQLMLRMAQLLDERHGDADRAAETYRSALAIDPGCRAALTELRHLSIRRGQWDVALQIAEAETSLEMSSDERAELLSEVGGMWLEHFSDAEQGLAHFERALEQDPAHPAALAGAARAAQRVGGPQQAAGYWERLAEQATGIERGRALVAWAGLEAAMGQPERAAELFRRALTDDPSSTDALDALTAIAEAEEQWPLLADLHERRFALTQDNERKSGIALAAGRVHLDHLDDPAAARVWLVRAAELDPLDPTVYRVIADIERARGAVTGLRRALERQIDCSGERVNLSALLELARLQRDAGDDDAGIELLKRALGLAPDDTLVVEALADALACRMRWDELADCLERRAALATSDPSTCAAVLAELGTVQEEHLEDIDAARQTYERALGADPTHRDVTGRLERIYRKQEAWDALRTLLEHTSRTSPDAERPAQLCTLGELLLTHFDDRDAVGRAFENALAIDSSCTAAHHGLQRLAEEGGDPEAILSAYEHEASVTTEATRLGFLVRELARIHESRGDLETALDWAARWMTTAPEDPDALRLAARLHEAQGHSDELLRLLQRLDPLLQSGEQAVNRRRIGALHLEAGQADAALDVYRGALEADPADVEALQRLVALLDDAGNALEELARTYQHLSELVEGPERAACLDALARLFEERLAEPARAIDALERLAGTEGAPGDVEDRLEVLLDRTARYEELAQRLSRRAAMAEGAERRGLEMRRANTLLEYLSLFDEAVEAFRDLVHSDPTCDAARSGLERALRAAGDTGGLADFLGEQAEAHPDRAVRERAALERAGILEQDPSGQHAAAELYRVLAVRASDQAGRTRAGERLTALLERLGDWAGLREHWESQLEAADESLRAELHERVARLCRDRLGDEAAAVHHLEAAAALAPERAELWQALGRLHEAAGRTPALVEVLEAEIRSASDPAEELPLRSRAAALCAGALQDRERARAHYQRVLELEPSDPNAGEFLIGCFEAEERHDAVMKVLEHRLESLDAQQRDADGTWASQRISLRLRIAGLKAGALDDPDGAIAVLEPGLGEVGPVAAIAEPLADLYERAGYSEDLIDLCRRAAERCEPGAERGAWHARRAETLRSQGDERGAADAYRLALRDRPDDDECNAALRDLYRRLDEAEPLARLLDAELTHVTGPAEIPMRMELAKLRMGPLADPAEALVQLRRIVHLDPGHAEALEKGLELAEHLERPDEVQELLEDALARPQPPSARATLLSRRARLLACRADDPDAAHNAASDYREALSLEPTRNDVREALRDLLMVTGQWEGALDCLFQHACHAASEDRTALWAEGARLAWEHLSPEAALPWLERVRREQPRDTEILARIAEVHQRAGRHRARLRALEAQVKLCGDAISRRNLEVECAKVLERDLDAPGRAAAALERARALCPEDADTLHQLDRLYRDLNRTRDRADVVEALVELAHDRERISLLCEAASLRRELAEAELAAGLLLRASAETPKSSAMYAELLRALGDALAAFAAPDVWARCAEAELAALDPVAPVFAERRLELRRGLAAAYQANGRREGALQHLRALVDAAPDGFDPSGALEASLLAGLRAQRYWVELEQRLAASLERRPDDPDGWLELARLREERLAATRPAADAYRRLLEVDPVSLAGLRGLRAAAECLGEWEEVARSLELELEHPESRASQRRSALLRRLGDVVWKHLHSTTRASRAYAAALEADPENFGAHRALERLLEAMEDWRGAVDLYESEVAVLGDREPQRRQAAWLRAGELTRDHTHEIHRALSAYVEAAALGELPVDRRAEQAELHRLCGDIDAFTAVYARWCDDSEAEVRCADHVRLARTLVALERTDEALARARRATEADPEDALAWDLVGRLEEASGESEAAAEAFDRATELCEDADAAERLLRAALLREPDAPQEAAERLRRAADFDPAGAGVQAALARVEATLERWDESETAALTCLELAENGELPDSLRLATALVGARSARAADRMDAAARLYETALELAPDEPEALSGAGETLFELDDYAAAAEALGRRLAAEAADPDAALHHALLARCLATAGETERALEHCEAALEEDTTQRDAHALCVEVHEAAGRTDAGVAALERWATQAAPAERARHLLRAAEWELAEDEQTTAAEAHLREALEADPTLAPAWERLALLLWDTERSDVAFELASRGLEADAPDARATLALVKARALEQRGEREAAADAYGVAADADPRCAEAAHSRARLLRAIGDWRGAADALDSFTRRHPGDDESALAEALHQLGRLRAGPLEDVEGAIDAYRRAVELDPDEVELRATLADLLSHRPDAWQEALSEHRAALERDPAHAPSLHAALRIARARDRETAVANGRCLLSALGIASPSDAVGAPERPSFRIADRGQMANPLHETLRLIAAKNEREIGNALEAPPGGLAEDQKADPVTAFRAAALEAEADLAARALLPLSSDEVGEVLICAATLALEPDGVDTSGAVLNALSGALGFRARRRIKRALSDATLADVQAVDFAAWRSDLRALAAASAVDEGAASLRTAFVALVCAVDDRAPSEIARTADLTSLTTACPEAHELLRRAVAIWLEEI